jgi:tetratricopeptide (TPR) repeat protein
MRISFISPLLGALVAASAAMAQEPTRPTLPDNGDPNDWEAYWDAGMKALHDDIRVADDDFRWASRVDPSRAEPLYAQFVMFHLHDVRRFSDYLRDDARTLRDRRVIAADSLQMMAVVRNPFVHRGLIAMAYDQLPGDWGNDLFTRAFLEYARGDLEAAARDLAALVHRSPGDLRARHHLALTLVNLRQYDAARVELDSVLAALRRRDERRVTHVYESKEMLLYSIGLLYMAQRRNDLAREAFAQGVLEDASQWYLHRGLGLALLADRRTDEALAEYRTAVELGGYDPVLLLEYGQALYDAGQYPAAVAQLSKLVEIVPDWAEGWLALGNASVRAGQLPQAITAFTAYLARVPRRDEDVANRVRASLEQLRESATPH